MSLRSVVECRSHHHVRLNPNRKFLTFPIEISHFERAVAPVGVVFGLSDSVELWVTGLAQRPPRVWRRQPGYPQRAAVSVAVLAGDHYAALLRRRSEPDWSRFW